MLIFDHCSPYKVPLEIWTTVVGQMLHNPKEEYRNSQKHEETGNKPELNVGLSVILIKLPYQNGKDYNQNQTI